MNKHLAKVAFIVVLCLSVVSCINNSKKSAEEQYDSAQIDKAKRKIASMSEKEKEKLICSELAKWLYGKTCKVTVSPKALRDIKDSEDEFSWPRVICPEGAFCSYCGGDELRVYPIHKGKIINVARNWEGDFGEYSYSAICPCGCGRKYADPAIIYTELSDDGNVKITDVYIPAEGGSIADDEYDDSSVKSSATWENGRECVDLGLSVKWAICNVGATSPSDYGGYFAWGETVNKSCYAWENCFDCLDGKGGSWNIYRFDGLTEITPICGRDPARRYWGGTWRMPTGAEIDELCRECVWTWTTSDGHYGCNVRGPNGNSIFFPAAGLRIGWNFYAMGEHGYYWSSTLNPSHSSEGLGLIFTNSSHTRGHGYRCTGRCVRPVTE